MIVLKEQNKKIEKIWGEGNIKNVTYRLMFYVIKAEVDDGLLMYNTTTSEFVHIDKEEQNKLSLLPCMYESWMDELIVKHFLVPIDFDEKKFVDSLRVIINLLESSDSILYTILPTTYCNARCYYCFEEGMKHVTMNDETADKIVRYIVDNRNDKKIILHWFGGEPLLGVRQIDRICNNLRKQDIPFESKMSTNGYLFDKELIAHAKTDWNLVHVQIPMDGTREAYNKAKAFINPKDDPYNKVMDNIGYLAEFDIEIEVRLNLGQNNFDEMNELVDQLADRYIKYDNIILYATILLENYGTKSVSYNSSELSYMLENLFELQKHILSYRPAKVNYLPHFNSLFCKVDGDSILFTPEGKLGKCDINIEGSIVGNVDEGITDKEKLKKIRKHIQLEKCSTCPFYPSCIMLSICESKLRMDVSRNCEDVIMDHKLKSVSTIMKKLYKQYKES